MAITNKIAIGHGREFTAPGALKAALAEFIATFLFVFIGLGSASAYYNLIPDEVLTPTGVIAIALAHGLALAAVIAATANISGGHVNPAVTFALAIGGNITILRGVLYWIGQLAGAVVASLVLKWIVVIDEPVPVHAFGVGTTWISALVTESILTFALVFVVYATAVDPKKGSIGVIAPLAIGITVLAGIFVGVAYSGASMNPARSFGPAVANWDFTNNWVYWVGPLIGGAIASLVYDGLFLSPEEHSSGPSDEFH